jgi:hypothetical protein
MQRKESDALAEKRRAIRSLLVSTDPADALTSYYALWHDPRRTQLTLHHDSSGRVDGFVAVCQTGFDLFRPLVTLRASEGSVVGEMLHTALVAGRPYQVVVPMMLASPVREQMDIATSKLTRTYSLDPSRFQPIINVLVQRADGPDGSMRFQIESQGQVVAMAGTNWRSPTFAEVFVYVHPRGRGRGWGRSVVSSCTAALLEERLRPLYLVEDEKEASIRIAEALGYADTSHTEFIGEGLLR